MKKFGYKTVMQVPRVAKITLNMGVGETTTDKKILDNAVADMTRIAGQKPVVTKARKSIANFKVRAGFPVGCMVTLRGARMYEFLDRLVNIAIPRIRDFPRRLEPRVRRPRQLQPRHQGTDHLSGDRVRQDRHAARHERGDQHDAKTDDEARALLAAFRFPFKH
jgi:large subunit ribosomal protein L5